MKFSEFKSFIETRQKLIKEKETNTSVDQDLNRRIVDIEKVILGSENYANIKLYKLFYVGTEEVQRFLERYFDGKEKVELGFSGMNLEFHLLTDTKLYRLGNYDSNQSLKCLFTGTTNSDWELLLQTYPDLKDFLWEEFKNLKTVSKRNELTLIQKKLNKRNEELLFLQNPEKVQTRIAELKRETKSMEKRLDEIRISLEDVNFN